MISSEQMDNIYTDGGYASEHPTWHAEDSVWKANQIEQILSHVPMQLTTVCEVGCGAGKTLYQLSLLPYFSAATLDGFDISPQAIQMASKYASNRLSYHHANPFGSKGRKNYDLLIANDVFEHVPDYMGFLEQCNELAQFKIYHIPLDLHVSGLLRNGLESARKKLGHLHYFSAESAIATLRDTGHEVLATEFTSGAIDLAHTHKSLSRSIANFPRRLVGSFSKPFSSRLFGGYSLLVVCK